MHSTVSTCDPEVVGRLCLLPSSFAALPLADEIAALVERELRTIPGVGDASVSLAGMLDVLAHVPLNPPPSTPPPAKDRQPLVLPIRTWVGRSWGEVRLHLDDAARYQPYAPFVQSLLSNLATELEKRAREKHLRLALESARLGTWYQELPEGHTYWDERTREIFGMDVEEPGMLERSLSIIHLEDWPRAVEAFKRAISPDGSGRFEAEQRIVCPDGTARWITATGQVLYCGEGEDRHPVAFSGLVADITAQKEMEQALRESEARFRAITDAAPMLIWMSGPDKRCTYFNERWLRFTGRTMKQELTDGWSVGIHADDLARCLKAYVSAFDRREPFEMEYRLRRHDGAYRWILNRGVPCIAPEGTFLGYIGSCFDIHDRKQAEEALRESQMMLRLILDSIPQGVFWKDRQGRYLGANAVAANAAGFENPDDLVGLTSYDVPGVTPEQAAFFQAKDREVMEHGHPLLGIEELRGHPDGSTSWLHTNKVPLHDASGRVVGVLGTWEDVTERKETEAALRESEARYRVLTEAASHMTWTISPDHSVEFVSQTWTQFTGRSIETAQREGWTDLIHPEDRPRTVAQIAELLPRGEPHELEFRLRRQDGAYRWVLARTAPLKDEHGAILKWIGTTTEIHDRKQAEEALREAEWRLRQALEAGALGTWAYNPATDTTHFDARSQAILGLNHAVLTTEEVDGLSHPDDYEALIRAREAALDPARTDIFKQTHRIVWPNGMVRWVRNHARVFFEGKGTAHRPVRAVGVLADVTEQVEAQETLRRMNETLEERVEARTKQVHELARRLTMAEQAERHRISQILHDDLQQQLYGIQMKLSLIWQDAEAGEHERLLDTIAAANERLDTAVMITRRLTVDLSPPILKTENLVDMLSWLRIQMQELHGLEVELQATHPVYLPDHDMRVLLFQIVRELLFNVVKHAETSRASVALEDTDDYLVIRVSDAGRGFDIKEATSYARQEEGGFGLFSVHERLRLFGGALTIDSAAGEGTRMTLQIPLSLE